MNHPYDRLTPDTLLDAIASVGLQPDGHLLALNSYENRVFQVGIDQQEPVVAKFYRPERWTTDAIVEEHEFARELAANDIPVVAPWRDATGRSLFAYDGFRFALFPRRGGRAPEPGDLGQLGWIGRFIGRIHLAGQDRLFAHRPLLDTQTLGWPARDAVMQSPLLPGEWLPAYADVSATLLHRVEETLASHSAASIRLHGDFHHGNILWTDAGPHFVDLDDCRNGPAMQDLWMLLNGSRQEQTLQLDAMLDGYSMFREFDPRELGLIEALRGLRLVHYSGWVAQRWTDPAFSHAFSWMAAPHYWSQHVSDLQQQLAALAEPPLALF